MKKKTEQPEEKKKAPTERERKQAVARIRAKREKIFDDSPEKPAFQERKEQFENRGFRHHYRSFRDCGLSRFDSFFNALYIVLTERSIERENEKMEKEGKEPDGNTSLEHHSFLLRLISFPPRLLGNIRGWFRSIGKKERGKGVHLRRFVHLKKYAMHYIILAVTLFVASFAAYQLTCPVVLQAQIDGKLIGVVENKHLVDSAINELEDNVEIILGKSFHFPHEIKYTFERSWSRNLTPKSEISERLYSYLSEYICTAAGLYVDDVLVAVCEDADLVQRGLDDFVNESSTGDEVGIYNEIRITTQAYPTDSILDYAEFRQLLKEMASPVEERKKATVTDSEVLSEILKAEEESEAVPAMALVADTAFVPEEKERSTSNRPQPIGDLKLDLYTAKIESYDTVIPFETRYVESSEHYTTMADITTRGADGKAQVEAKVFYVEGKEVRREIISEKVKKKPVDRIISIGTKVLPESIPALAGAGNFIVPRVGYVSHYYGPRGGKMHSGWDIPGDEGDNVYAAASGTVVVAIGPDGFFAENTANHYTGYGYCVVIRHADGFSTMYAHCSAIHVTLGQEVKQGDKIADVGNTGRSDGDHVHFEVILNGQRVDPEPYMYKGSKTIYD